MNLVVDDFYDANFYNDTSELYEFNGKFDPYITILVTGINVYITPILVLLGTMGNLLSVYTFFSSKLRLQSTSQYLTALAISDTLFLLQLLPPWLNALKLSKIFRRPGFCQLFNYLTYVTCCLSSWLVVAFTIERFVAVVYPLRRKAMCTKTRARYIIGALVATALTANLPVLRFAVATNSDCTIDERYISLATNFNLVDTVLVFSIPLVMIIVLNICIVVGVYRINKARERMIDLEQPTEAPGGHRPIRIIDGSHGSQHRVTRMLLIVSTVFVALNLPAYITRIVAYTNNFSFTTWQLTANETESTNYNNTSGWQWEAFQQMTIVFFNANFGINFLLYCLNGQNFRTVVAQVIPCGRILRLSTAARRDGSFRPHRSSSVSAATDGSSSNATSNIPPASGTPHPRRHINREAFIARWTFDNNRQRLRQQQQQTIPDFHHKRENYEMQIFSTNANENAYN